MNAFARVSAFTIQQRHGIWMRDTPNMMDLDELQRLLRTTVSWITLVSHLG